MQDRGCPASPEEQTKAAKSAANHGEETGGYRLQRPRSIQCLLLGRQLGDRIFRKAYIADHRKEPKCIPQQRDHGHRKKPARGSRHVEYRFRNCKNCKQVPRSAIHAETYHQIVENQGYAL
jgi:hypothetical protein